MALTSRVTSGVSNDLAAKRYLKLVGDCGAALIAGGAAFSLGFMVAGTPIRQSVFLAVTGLYVACVFMAQRWRNKAAILIDRRQGFLESNASYLALAVVTGLLLWASIGSIRWPIPAFSSGWWVLVVASLAATLTGAVIRRITDFNMELDDFEGITRAASAVTDESGVTDAPNV